MISAYSLVIVIGLPLPMYMAGCPGGTVTHIRPVNGWPGGAWAVNLRMSSLSSPWTSANSFSMYSK
jgi:hypothetical protein